MYEEEREEEGRLQWIAPASPFEVAGGRIISFLLMSSTSWEGGESITLLPLFPSPPSLRTLGRSRCLGTYCIRDERHNNLPHAHNCPFCLLFALCVSVIHTLLRDSLFLLG